MYLVSFHGNRPLFKGELGLKKQTLEWLPRNCVVLNLLHMKHHKPLTIRKFVLSTILNIRPPFFRIIRDGKVLFEFKRSLTALTYIDQSGYENFGITCTC